MVWLCGGQDLQFQHVPSLTVLVLTLLVSLFEHGATVTTVAFGNICGSR